MVRERKCILCEIVYSSKKEMDEHMRSMLHHRELENLRGRDCSHECRVCRVTVVGLSTYAKHISSQLHKEKVDIQDKVEEKDEVEEEYFDKELIHLINERKEQSRQDDDGISSKDQGTDRYKRRKDERFLFQEVGPQEWHNEPSQRSWQWQNECFSNPRQGKFSLPGTNHNRHLNGSRGRAGWHLNGPSNRHQIHGKAGGSWHSNAAGPTSWHHRGTGRNFHWHQEGNGNFNILHPRNWQPDRYSGNRWNGNGTDSFPQVRNRSIRHCDSTQEKEPGWNKTNCNGNKFNKERFSWKREDTKSSNKSALNSEDFTSDKLPDDSLFELKTLEKPGDSSATKTLPGSGKSNISSKDRPHRWSPYPSQKVIELPQTLETDVSESRNDEKLPDQSENLAKRTMKENTVTPETCGQSNGKKVDQGEVKGPRIPSLKPPLRNIPDMKSSSFKRDQRNLLKGVKLQFPLSFGERQNRLSALNLETVKSNSYISKLRSASRNTSKINLETPESSQKEPDETLGDVLRKAKEMLENSQAIQNPYLPSMKDAIVGPDTIMIRASKIVKEEACPVIDLSEATHDSTSDGEGNVEILFSSKCSSPSLANYELFADHPAGANTSLEQISTNTDVFPVDSTRQSFTTQNDTESVDEGSGIAKQGQDYLESESFDNASDQELGKSASHSSSPLLPELNKLGLPASLKRDLTRHISSRAKTGAHPPEPNLNSARRVRNVSGHRKNEIDKDSGLKPTLRQILNASRRNINWEQVIQHVTKKKQEMGKGLPRFGIEMVAQVQHEQEGLDFDEESDLGIESFHWEGGGPLSARKRSLSESSVAIEKASVYDMFTNHGSDVCWEQDIPTTPSTPAAPGPNVSSTNTLLPKQEMDMVSITSPALTGLSDLTSVETSPSRKEDAQIRTTSDSPRTFQNANEDTGFAPATVFSVCTPADVGTDSSGTEQNDGQGSGKKRRATGDGYCPEIPSLETNRKRRKIRGRKERSQVDQLLNISLREEELNNSLVGVDTNLQKARSVLQAAYLEVQRLLVLKQQITMEMSTMRTQRIQILQGLQENYEPAGSVTEETNSRAQAAPLMSPGNIFSFLLETPPYTSPHVSPSSTVLPTPGRVCTPPAFQAVSVPPTVPDNPLQVKQEPLTPEKAGEDMITSPSHGSGKTTSVYPVITATMSLAELTDTFSLISGEQSIARPRSSDVPSLSPADIKPSLSSSYDHQPVLLESCFQAPETWSIPSPGATNDCLTGPPDNQQAESTLHVTEAKVGKKKKKLRKKKTLRAARVPENSDTEQDTCKPIRKVRARRFSKDTTVSTSTSPEQELEATSQAAGRTKGGEDSDSNVELVEIPNQQFEVVALDSESEEEKPDSPCKTDPVKLRETNSETHDEVTSTSELGTSYEETLGSMVDHRRASLRSKNSSEISSEPGDDDDPTEGTFQGHRASVNSIQIFGGLLYTCSADKTVHVYNLVTRQCVDILDGHTSKVNCLIVTHTYGKSAMLFTGSSDHTIRCYSVKTREFVEQIDLGERVLCLHVRWRILYAGLANGTVVTFSLKNNKQIDVFECHGPRAVSCLATAQEGARRLLLVGSYDCTISVRDARNGLLLRTLEGHTKTVLCMKVVNDLVFSGSSDQSVHAHNIHTGELVRIYKGHNHAVTVVNILGNVMVTACLDKFVRVYELQSHDRLQVYGGHSDMIMCMAIHKSMIYTGCYDGSIQGVRLNLMQNYRCWWHGCTLIFGVADHLKQHLLTDHTNPNFQTLKCRWKNCDAFFTARRGSKQDAVGHIERHAEEHSRINT
ncbi:zinc finger protein 106 isoform 2-T2 [Pelodytes ibericus]